MLQVSDFGLIRGAVRLTVLVGLIPTMISYSTNETLLPALKLLLQAGNNSSELHNIPEYRYDIVSLTRQFLSNRFNDYYLDLTNQFNSSTTSAQDIRSSGSTLIRLLGDLDSLLHTDENFLLSTWIADARQWAGTGQESNTSYLAYLEYNARNQLTLWGPDGQINDYASKQWAGLVGGYYTKRWEMFIDYLASLKENGQPYNDTVIAQQLLDFGKEWDMEKWGTREGEFFGTKGDTMEVAHRLVETWG